MSKKVSQIALAALAFAAVAVLAFGQSTDKNATTTTAGKYKIALVAPIEGASVAADQVRVILTPNTNAMGNENTQVDVFLDDHQKGTLKTNETEFRVDGVRPGPHKIVLIARNPVTDQQFDRREINFVATGAGSATRGVSSVSENALGAHVPPAVSSAERKQTYTAKDGTTSTQVAENEMPATSSSSSYSTNPAPAPASGSSSAYSSNPAPAPEPNSGSSSSAYSNRTYSNSPSAPSGSMSSSSSSSTRSMGGTDNEQLPKTASSDGLLLLAGAALLVTGAVLRRSA